MRRAVFPQVPDPADARPLQSPTVDDIARIRDALPTGIPIMKGKWESMGTAPRDGRPVWGRFWTYPGFCAVLTSGWIYCGDRAWLLAGTVTAVDPSAWLNPEAAP